MNTLTPITSAQADEYRRLLELRAALETLADFLDDQAAEASREKVTGCDWWKAFSAGREQGYSLAAQFIHEKLVEAEGAP